MKAGPGSKRIVSAIKMMNVSLFIILAGHTSSWANNPNTEAWKNYFKPLTEDLRNNRRS